MQPVVGRDDLTVTIGWSAPDGLVCENSVEATAAESAAMQRAIPPIVEDLWSFV